VGQWQAVTLRAVVLRESVGGTVNWTVNTGIEKNSYGEVGKVSKII
jgi:hypothetical protein